MSANSTNQSGRQDFDALDTDKLLGFDLLSTAGKTDGKAVGRLLNKRGDETPDIQQATGRLLNKASVESR